MLKRKMLALLISVCTVFAVAVGFVVFAKVLANKAESASYECLQGDISVLEGVTFNAVVNTEKFAYNSFGEYSNFNHGASVDTYSFTVENGRPFFRLKTDNKAFYKEKEDDAEPPLSDEILSIDSGIVHKDDVHKYTTYKYLDRNFQLYSKDNNIYVCVYNPETRDRKDILIAEGDNVEINRYGVYYPEGFDKDSEEFDGKIKFLYTYTGIMFYYYDFEKETSRIIVVSIDDKTETVCDCEIKGEIPEYLRNIFWDNIGNYYPTDNMDFFIKDDKIHFFSFEDFYEWDEILTLELHVNVIGKDEILFDGIIYNGDVLTGESYSISRNENGIILSEIRYDRDGNLITKGMVEGKEPVDFSHDTGHHTYIQDIVSVNMRFDE